MIPSEFEEKEYETLMNAHLALRATDDARRYSKSSSSPAHMPSVFSPGQVLEKHLGFDFSVLLDPLSPTYALLFGAPTPMSFSPLLYGPVYLPPEAAVNNCFLQYKRPECATPGHRQPVWKRQQFWRFDVRSGPSRRKNHDQLEALVMLDQGIGERLVRYACPATHSRHDLRTSYKSGQLLRQSVFVKPGLLARNSGSGWHNYWTFVSSSNGFLGQGNPDGDEVPLTTADTFWDEADYISVEGFGSVIGALKRNVSNVRGSMKYFSRDEVVEGRRQTLGDWVESRVARVQEDLMGSAPEMIPKAGVWSVPSRERLHEAVPKIMGAVEVAATAQALGLKWVITNQRKR